MTARVLVHTDGGACHGTPIVDGRCPKCGIAPDTQSVELWPALAATADKKPGDAFYAFADALPSPPTMILVTQPPERRPCAGWAMAADGRLVLDGGKFVAKVRDHGYVNTFGHGATWVILLASDRAVTLRLGYGASLEAAQLAAEDALRAIAAEILRAVEA